MKQLYQLLKGKLAVSVESKFAKAFAEAPHLPKDARNFIVRIIPWFALFGGIASSIAALGSIFAAFGFRPSFLWFSAEGGIAVAYYLTQAVLQAVSGYLLLNAFDFLRNKAAWGWKLLFWNEALSITSALASAIVLNHGSVLGVLIVTLISLYIIFEIKPYYQKKEAIK